MKSLFNFTTALIFTLNSLVCLGPALAADKLSKKEELWNQYQMQVENVENLNSQITAAQAIFSAAELLTKQLAENGQILDKYRRELLFMDAKKEPAIFKKKQEMVSVLTDQISLMEAERGRLAERGGVRNDDQILTSLQQKVDGLTKSKNKFLEAMKPTKAQLVMEDQRFDKFAKILARKKEVERKKAQLEKARNEAQEAWNKFYPVEDRNMFIMAGSTLGFVALLISTEACGNGTKGLGCFVSVGATALGAGAAIYVWLSQKSPSELERIAKSLDETAKMFERRYEAEVLNLNTQFDTYEALLELN